MTYNHMKHLPRLVNRKPAKPGRPNWILRFWVIGTGKQWTDVAVSRDLDMLKKLATRMLKNASRGQRRQIFFVIAGPQYSMTSCQQGDAVKLSWPTPPTWASKKRSEHAA